MRKLLVFSATVSPLLRTKVQTETHKLESVPMQKQPIEREANTLFAPTKKEAGVLNNYYSVPACKKINVVMAQTPSKKTELKSDRRRTLNQWSVKKVFMAVAIFAFAIAGSVANGQAIKVLSNGNVGIGTTTPAYKFHVAGTAKATQFAVDQNVSSLGFVLSDNFTYAQKTLGHYSLGWYSDPWCPSGNSLCASGWGGIKFFTKGAVRFSISSIGDARFYAGWVGLILGWSYDDYCPAIYSDYNNYLHIGRPDRWANHLWVYAIDYQNLHKTSDIRLKENIRLVPSVLSKLRDISTYNYNYTDEYFKDFTSEQKQKAQKTEFGFLAQELQGIFPELVRTNDSGIMSISYIDMIPILTAAINEMQEKVENRDSMINAMQQEMETLKATLIACCNNKSQKSFQQFELTDPTDASSEELKVFQNIPNPFTENTIITCYVPESIQKAELCVYDMQGSLLKCLTVAERGTTSVQIQAGQLSAGVYTYLLMGDDKTSDAKQMILTK